MDNKFNLISFEIEGLNNDRNVSLTFDNNVRVLLGENGTGKTTILSMLYYILSRKLYYLNNFEFDKVHLNFSSNKTITIEKEWISLEDNKNAYRFYKYLEEELSKDELDYVMNIIYGEGTVEGFKSLYFQNIRMRNISMHRIRRHIQELRHLIVDNDSNEYKEKLMNVDKELKETFESEVIYFPTYRRIEDDLSKLGLSIDDGISKSPGVINFGMNDVEETFTKIKNDIKDESLTSYSNVTGNMIKHLIYPNKGQHPIEEDNLILENEEILAIVLDRFGKDLNIEDKKHIFELISTRELFNDEYSSLSFYLKNLLNNYMQYKERDDLIKKFANKCTKYLVNKKVQFNESNGELSILNERNDKKIELNSLSSGEKQIVSILAKVFLNFSNDFIILIDEPELSLSIEWQEMLLPDITETGKCSLLFAVTHSPFIFDNNLDQYAKGIEMFVEEIND
ncbi:L-arabinose transporter ATP-binding protein [Oceanobacillus oncorhynchi]|uniref:L-arabinose transporter ATP-binding protein n=1 Tax=Oceanobacillus oncorhynchi TaxID=545501 RepID=A0A0A1MLM3_9BACI|nr:AAA family ATPase [Oceanobacillus oncorhynchi]CEI80724.1 L-arabinose transporter ATP-binding protein [Oceanobacillus oncorhynchi]